MPSPPITPRSSTVPGGSGYDHLSITGQLNVTSISIITVENAGYVGGFGDVFNLIDWNGNALDNSFNIGDRYRTGGEVGLDLVLPDISSFDLLWDTNLFSQHGILLVVPDPPAPCCC
jgi:fibronectin-binding autotransporter adhesin